MPSELDLIDRLLDRSVEGNCIIADAGLMQEAAEEVERLRAELNAYKARSTVGGVFGRRFA